MTFVEKMAASFEDELKKIAAEKAAAAALPHKPIGKFLPGMAVGALGTFALQRAHRDWRMGRTMRLQNQSY